MSVGERRLISYETHLRKVKPLKGVRKVKPGSLIDKLRDWMEKPTLKLWVFRVLMLNIVMDVMESKDQAVWVTVATNVVKLSTCVVQGKIERWHQTMKNRVLLENYYLPGDLERQIGAFVDYYNNERYHESLNNVTPADVYFGRDKAIIRERAKIKKLTIQNRRLQHQKQAA